MTEPSPDLRAALDDLAAEVTNVDLRERALRTSRRLRIRSAALAAAAVVALVGIGGFGALRTLPYFGATSFGPAGQPAPAEAPEPPGAGCAPVADERLVGLVDDRRIVIVDNIVPLARVALPDPALRAVNRVSAVLTQPRLIALNRATDVDNTAPEVAAQDFAAATRLTDGIERSGSGPLVVAAGYFHEHQTLAHLYRIALAAAGYDATVRQLHPTVGRAVWAPALDTGQVDVVPEYAGSLTEYLNQRLNGADAPKLASADLAQTVANLTQLARRAGWRTGVPAEAANQPGFAVPKRLADRYGLTTMSEFAARCSGPATVMGGPPDCVKGEFCPAGLEGSYGLAVGRYVALDLGGPETRAALVGGRLTLGVVFTSTPALDPAT